MKSRQASGLKCLSGNKLEKLLLYVKDQADLARRKGNTRAIVDEMIVLLLLNTGLRQKELCSLDIKDLPVTHGKKNLWIRDNTGNITRKVDIHSDVVQSLQKFVRLYRKGAKSVEPLLINERGNRFGYISIYSKIRRMGDKSGIGKLYPDMLRNSYIIRLYKSEQDLRLVQEQAGHASPRTTARYAKKSPQCKPKTERINDRDILLASELTEQHDKLTKEIVICEGCDKPISIETAQRIESGQILCQECIKYFCSV